MISSFPYIHVGKWFFSMKRNKRRLLLFFIFFLVVFLFRIAALAALINLYILSGPLIALWNKFKASPENATDLKSQTA
jgi:cytoskeletal protein RodZ